MTGSVSYHSGLAAENSVAAFYEGQGYMVAARRWRSAAGEIDLVARRNGNVIFVEVKKSRTLDRAACSLSRKQISRIYASAAMFLEGEPNGQDSAARFDLATVDAVGRISVLENAICA